MNIPVIGKGLAIIARNSKRLLICDILHVPNIGNLLYSMQAHRRQWSPGFLGMHGSGMFVYFTTFTFEVNTSRNYHLVYAPIGRQVALSDLNYVRMTQIRRASFVGLSE